MLSFIFLGHFFQNFWPVKDFSSHDTVQDDLNIHQESGPDFIQCEFILLLVYRLSENLVISEAHLIILACEIQHMIDYGCTFRMVFGHIQGTSQ